MTTRFRTCIIALLALATPSVSAGPNAAAAEELLPAETPIAGAVDHYINATLQSEEISPAPRADDSTLLRRLTLDLAGRIPTAAEARATVDCDNPGKLTNLVDRLLAAPDFPFHQRNELDLLLLADKTNDRKWRDYLLQAARENHPWHQMFREMMLGREGVPPDEDAALAFLVERAKELDKLTNDASRLFFGVSIDCARCHDHPLVDDWKQDHYFGFSSFFSRTFLTKNNLVAEKPTGEVKFKTTSGEEKKAGFMFLTGTVIEEPEIEKTAEERKKEDELIRRLRKDENAPLPEPPDFSPRAELVRIALQDGQDRFFARAIVNRIWLRLLGRGLVDPPDQMHSGNPPSHPELLEWLARDLVDHGYDLKRLIRGIVLSETYARSSRWQADGDPPYAGYFAVALPRPLTPRQYSLSLLLAAANPEQYPLDVPEADWNRRREQLEKSTDGWFDRFDIPDGSFQVSADEALFLSNNEKIENDLLRNSDDRLVGYLKKIDDPRRLIEEAFRAVLSRPPQPEETEAFAAYLAERQDRHVEGIQQIVWALLASPEMRFNY